jgi:23S rRNA (uracil1939-C5)-methyltransferase
MTERLAITRIGHRGDGIADTPDGPVYAPYTLPGETVTAEAVPGHPDRRHLLEVETASPDRVPPICPYFGICGGCAFQHWALPRQQAWKRQQVVDALNQARVRADVGTLIDAPIDSHGEGRRRAVFHARSHGDVLTVGFAATRAHHVVAIDHCPILASGLAGAVPAAWAIAEALKSAGKPLDIQVTETAGGLDVDVRGSGALARGHVAALATVAAQHRLARLTRHGELIAQRTAPMVAMGRANVTLPPGAFLQATVAGETTLAELVLTYAGKAKTVADLFCGVGPFALRLAERAKVAAADSDAAAITALTAAIKSTSGLKPVAAQARDLFRRPLVPMELKGFDAVVFDPPRQGAQAQARELAASAVPVVVAVSCDAQTFARDAAILAAGGYRLTAVTPVDQFRYSPHIEIVARFARD